MQKYSLEIENWGTWELERDFASFDRAKTYGLDRFPQSEWRIIERTTGEIQYHHESLPALEVIAQQESSRFANEVRWRNNFAQRQVINEVASRQRTAQAERAESRRNRLRGFHFVGEPPPIVRRGVGIEDGNLRAARIAHFADLFLHGEDRPDINEKVNWKTEGF
jgi:hypothetical protein